MGFLNRFFSAKRYDLETLEGIESIDIPIYKKLDGGVQSPTKNIEYILQRKATEHKRNGRMDLAIACLKKSNEIFPHSNFLWSKDDYLRLVYFLRDAGKFEEAKAEEEKIDLLFNKNLSALVLEKVLSDCESLNTDLVKVGDNERVCSSCALYTRRIFSIKGKDKRFPILPDILIQNIQNHEYCYISIYPFLFDYSFPVWEYKGNLIDWSNRPLKDERSEQQKKYYRDYVIENESLILDRKIYDLLREQLPEMAPKSFGGFRRMKNLRSKNYLSILEVAKKASINIDDKPDLSIFNF